MPTANTEQNPFLPIRASVRRETSDEEYVANIEKSLRRWERWRWLVILVHLAILAIFLSLGFSAVNLIKKFHDILGNQNVMPEGVVLTGIILGINVGLFLHNSTAGVVNALAGFRKERLIVQYFNRLNEGRNASSDRTFQ